MTSDALPPSSSENNPAKGPFKRWYDHDPLLMEVLEVLQSFEADLHEQAQLFLQKIEAQVGKDTLGKFYDSCQLYPEGKRWYDKDPVVAKAVELLRVVPPEVQRQAAQKFLEAMKKQGLSLETLKSE